VTHPAAYSRAQIALHWSIVALVAAQYIFKDAIATAWTSWRETGAFAFSPLIPAHMAGGGLILALVLWRIALRKTRGAPAAPADESPAIKALATVSHASLNIVLILLSISGMVAWFGGVVPAAQAHNVLKVVLLGLVVLHVMAALYHHVVLKHDVLRRMIRPVA
jgi:cytochrome b561